MFSGAHDLGSEILIKFAAQHAAATAGGAGDNAETTGVTIDTTALGTRYNSVAFALSARAVLAAAATLSVTGKIEHSDDGVSWSDLVESATLLTLTGGAGGSMETGTAVMKTSLEYAKRYIREKFTPDLSAGATDTATVQSVAIFGGPERMPIA